MMSQVPRMPGVGVNYLSHCNRSCGNCSNELSISELGPDQYAEGFFRYSEIIALRSYSQARIKLPIDNEQMVRIVETATITSAAGHFGSMQFFIAITTS